MSNRIPFTISANSITVLLYGVPKVIDAGHPNFKKVFDLLKVGVSTDEQAIELESLISIPKAIEKAVAGANFGDVTVGIDSVLYKGQPINNYLTQSMLGILALGVDIAPWAKFMNKLYQNPSKTAVDELFLWLDKANMPITADGDFLAYKKVKDDYTSYHTAPGGVQFHNTPGSLVQMPRNQVDDNRDKTCSSGLHFCSWHYLPSYYGGKGKVILVKINPANVVSIPSDYDNAKGRASEYVVVGEIDEDKTRFAFEGQHIVDLEEEDEDDNFVVFF